MAMERTASDSWFVKRMMKLTRVEKWFVNSLYHARHTDQAALALMGLSLASAIPPPCKSAGLS